MLKKIIHKIDYRKSLSKEENRYLFQICNSMTDNEQKNEIKELLYLGNIGLVVKELKKINYPMYMHDELMSYGSLGLQEAIDHFNLSKNVAFSSFALKVIHNHICDGIKNLKHSVNVSSYAFYKANESKENKYAEMLTKFELLSLDDVNDIYYSDFDIEEHIIRREEIESLYRAIEKLPPDEQELLFEKYLYNGKGYSYEEIANRHQTNTSKVYRKVKRILKEVKSYMEEKNNEKK